MRCRRTVVAATLSVLFALPGCATRMDVRSQATAGGLSAYELRGHSLDALRAEADRLCPQGVDVLRQWQQQERPEQASGFLRRWTLDLVDTPGSQAQLQIACRG